MYGARGSPRTSDHVHGGLKAQCGSGPHAVTLLKVVTRITKSTKSSTSRKVCRLFLLPYLTGRRGGPPGVTGTGYRQTGDGPTELITEIQIGQRMLGIIESSARYAQAMEAAARQRQQTYDDG